MAGTIGQGETPEKRPVVPYLGAVKVAAAVMAVMIVAGIGILGVTVMKRAGGGKPETANVLPAAASAAIAAPTAFGEVSLQLPPRARVLDMAMDQQRLVLHLQLAGREKALMIVDLETGRSLGMIRLKPDPLEP
ncbi:hypothetical protein BAL199_04694 [alpha proteobacterium BAL199]|jgi:hypothetical protein|nr:hypothetical protein BAL199_04694 [alpha proteobacterium BAL199]